MPKAAQDTIVATASPSDMKNSNSRTHSIFHKTSFCRFYRAGRCTRGSACTFAHTKTERTVRPNLGMTKLCPYVLAGERCTTTSCGFAHSRDELRKLDFQETAETTPFLPTAGAPFEKTAMKSTSQFVRKPFIAGASAPPSTFVDESDLVDGGDTHKVLTDSSLQPLYLSYVQVGDESQLYVSYAKQGESESLCAAQAKALAFAHGLGNEANYLAHLQYEEPSEGLDESHYDTSRDMDAQLQQDCQEMSVLEAYMNVAFAKMHNDMDMEVQHQYEEAPVLGAYPNCTNDKVLAWAES